MSSLPSNVSDSASPAAASSGKSAPLTTGHGAEQVATGIWLLHGQGQSFVAETSVGLVVVDAGPGGEVTASMIDALRQCSEAPVHALCYSHGHVGYNAGVPQWLEHAHLRGEPAPRLIAHQNVPRRYARYRETSALQQHLNGMQFRMAPGDFEVRLCDPQELFERHLVIGEGDRRVELLWAPSETDCSIAVWCPVQRVLYGGPAVIDSIPNVGTPLRTQRDPVRWADSLEDLMRLRPEKVVREFGATISGADAVQHVLGTTVRALRWLRAETVRLMNEGLDERELLARIAYPEDLFGATWMRPTYGDPSYIVRDIYRSENGWWDRNPTSLHPAAPSEVARALAEAISDKATVLNHARQLAERGQLQLALHVIDLLAQAEGEAPEISEARRLKARWLRERARQVKSYVSKSLFHHGASQLESAADVAVPAPT